MTTDNRESKHKARAGVFVSHCQLELQHHDRAWWRVEARRLGSDWPEILRLQAEVVATWRARHDAETRAAT
jgi:hypothetical protein